MDFALPEIGEGVYEAELVGWLVKLGETVKRGQALAEVMTDKANMEVPSPFAGSITELRARPGTMVKVGEVLLSYTDADQPAAVPRATEPAPKPAAEALARAATVRSANGPTRGGASRLPVKAAPSVRQLARKLGIDLGRVHGTGPGGRVLIDDIAPHVVPERHGASPRTIEPAFDYGTPGTRVPLQGLRKRIAERMALSRQTIPEYTYVDECDVTDLVRLRGPLKETFLRAGIKLTYLPFVVKAVVGALKDVPLANASLDEKAGEIVLHDHYHIGIAVATPAGLVVPVVHDADTKDVAVLAREIERLSAEARAGRSKLEDLRGGTFTITLVGSIGGLIATPVINPPEVGILAVGRIVKRPVFDEHGQVRAADMVYLSLAFDHRVVDGAVCAAFGNALIRRLQAPATLLLPSEPTTLFSRRP